MISLIISAKLLINEKWKKVGVTVKTQDGNLEPILGDMQTTIHQYNIETYKTSN